MAFSYAGLVNGIIATILTALICTHCAYVLVKCAHTLYRRTRRTAMNFSEVAEVAFANGKLCLFHHPYIFINCNSSSIF